MVRKQLRNTIGDKNLSGMANGIINGFKPIVERGNLGMVKVDVVDDDYEAPIPLKVTPTAVAATAS
jgi:hypothetical protein